MPMPRRAAIAPWSGSRAQPWDVVLCDLRMPGLDGIELLRTIGQQHPGVDVVVMTAYGTVETAVTAIRNGAADYLTKPFRFQELEHRLRKLGELRGFRREVDGLRALLAETDDPDAGSSVGRRACVTCGSWSRPSRLTRRPC